MTYDPEAGHLQGQHRAPGSTHTRTQLMGNVSRSEQNIAFAVISVPLAASIDTGERQQISVELERAVAQHQQEEAAFDALISVEPPH
ncbi:MULTISPECIES: hypothetical protein [Rhizobiaceae]|uniref:hypothetical protein n=1 Tax=Rhizobiaceae TaxID=82115 RepID=UPI0018297A75|nr:MULTISPECIES: hypothetical protein [Rhizobiaceae]